MVLARAANTVYSKDGKVWFLAVEIEKLKGHISEYQFMRVNYSDGSFDIFDLWKKKI